MRYAYLLLTALISLPAGAGPKVNNGGGAWRCRAGEKTVWMSTVDITNPNGVNLRPLPAKSAVELFLAVKAHVSAASPPFAKLLARYDLDLTRIDYVNASFAPIGDAYLFDRPGEETCPGGSIDFVQVANYVINDRLLISRPAWQDPAFSERDKAAILMHELFYRLLRAEYGDENSVRARRLTVLAFSTLSLAALKEDLEYVLDGEVPKDGRDQVPGFTVDLKCVAALADLRSGLSESAVWSPGARGGRWQVSLGGFQFRAEASAADGIPDALAIEAQGLTAASVAGDVRPIILALGNHGISLADGKNEASLRCWVKPQGSP